MPEAPGNPSLAALADGREGEGACTERAHRPGAVVVLGCTLVFSAGRLSGALGHRIGAAAEAFARSDGAPLLVVSGGRAWGGRVEADAMRAELVDRGVPDAKIVRERCSLTTRENARFTAALLRRRGITNVTVVTSAWHLPRAEALFRAQGLNVIGVPAAPEEARSAPPLMRLWRWGREQVAARIDGVGI